MTIAELLANEELRQHEFPVTREKIFLAHAGDCPLPRRVAEAITQYTRGATTGDQEKLCLSRPFWKVAASLRPACSIPSRKKSRLSAPLRWR